VSLYSDSPLWPGLVQKGRAAIRNEGRARQLQGGHDFTRTNPLDSCPQSREPWPRAAVSGRAATAETSCMVRPAWPPSTSAANCPTQPSGPAPEAAGPSAIFRRSWEPVGCTTNAASQAPRPHLIRGYCSLVKFASSSLLGELHIRKKKRNRKNLTVRKRKSDSLFRTVEFFSDHVFFLYEVC
jgi:hypothetical protein